MQTFLRAAEIWVPDADGQLLEFGSGAYDRAPAFGHASRGMCFGRGEGLPGNVWDQRMPIVLTDLQGGYFQRAAAARAAGLVVAVGLPVFFGESLKAVVVIFCGAAGVGTGSVTLTPADAAGSLPPLLQDHGRRLTLSVATPGSSPYLVCFESTDELAVATRIERWIAGADAQSLRRVDGVDEALGSLAVEERSALDPMPPFAAFAVFASGLPQTGPGPQIALPQVRDGEVAEVIVLHF